MHTNKVWYWNNVEIVNITNSFYSVSVVDVYNIVEEYGWPLFALSPDNIVLEDTGITTVYIINPWNEEMQTQSVLMLLNVVNYCYLEL